MPPTALLPPGYRKRSFLRFSARFEFERLRAEVGALPDSVWLASYWGDIHCSIGMLLLKGGGTGAPEDFYCDEVREHSVLEGMPYLREFIGRDGPFGAAEFAFLFRMEPHGVTRAHHDYQDRWHDLYRIHVPLTTNKGAFLVADGRSQHFEAGYAWSFDNQSRHGVVNGPHARVHLIMDVPFSEKMAAEIDRADYLPGRVKRGHVDRISADVKVRPSYPGDPAMRTAIESLRARGLTDERIADFLNAKSIPAPQYDPIKPNGLISWTTECVARLGD